MGFIEKLFHSKEKPESSAIASDNAGSVGSVAFASDSLAGVALAGAKKGRTTVTVRVNGKLVSGGEPGDDVDREVASVGPQVEQARGVGDFVCIEAGGNFEVEWTQGPVSAMVVASVNIQKMVRLDQSAGLLRLHLENGDSPADPVKVRLSSPGVQRLTLFGACQASVGPATLPELAIKGWDSASVKVEALAAKLVVALSGVASARARFAGEAMVEASGMSTVTIEGVGSLSVESSENAEVIQNGGLCHKARLTSTGVSTISAQLTGMDNVYHSAGASGVECLLADGGAVVGGRSELGRLEMPMMTPQQEAEARKNGEAYMAQMELARAAVAPPPMPIELASRPRRSAPVAAVAGKKLGR